MLHKKLVFYASTMFMQVQQGRKHPEAVHTNTRCTKYLLKKSGLLHKSEGGRSLI